MLRISGRVLNVDKLLESVSLTNHPAVVKVYRRGEPRLHIDPKRRRSQYSGVNICVGDAGFREFERQIQQAVRSLKRNRALFRKLVSFRGVDDAVLDFGIAFADTYTQTDLLPAELISLAGQLGFAIHISHYPVSKPKTKNRKRS